MAETSFHNTGYLMYVLCISVSSMIICCSEHTEAMENIKTKMTKSLKDQTVKYTVKPKLKILYKKKDFTLMEYGLIARPSWIYVLVHILKYKFGHSLKKLK